ncbi:MAG: hypothetical protein ACQESD_04095 [Thermoplasmatota archaeon]
MKDLHDHLAAEHGMDQDDYQRFLGEVDSTHHRERFRNRIVSLMIGTFWAALFIVFSVAFLYNGYVFNLIPINMTSGVISLTFIGFGSAMILRSNLEEKENVTG